MIATAERPLGVAGRIALSGLYLAGLLVALIDPFTLLFFATYASVGALLAVRRPRNVIGWLMVAIAISFVGTSTHAGLDAAALEAGTASMGDFLIAWWGAWAGLAAFSGFIALTVLFPSGRLPDGRWRRPAAALIGCAVGLVAMSALAPTLSYNPDGGPVSLSIPNAFALLPDSALWAAVPVDLLIAPLVALFVVGVIAMLYRYRRSTGVTRLQLRWLVAALAFVLAAVVMGLASVAVLSEDPGAAAWIPAMIAFPTVPVAIYVAVTRYRLYEIDRIISRTIGWALVTALLVAVFALGVVALQALLEPVTEQNALAVAGSTLLAAALFQPLRARIQRAVDRRFDRARYDGERTAAAFSERLRHEVDLDTLATEIGRVVTETVRPTSAAVWLRSVADRAGTGGS